MKLNIVLYQPVIPQNTGSVARMCACTSAVLHLIHPLGFKTDEASVRRAGLDYWEHVAICEHRSWSAFLEAQNPRSMYFLSKFSNRPYSEIDFKTEDSIYLVFGSETKGLPEELHRQHEESFLQIPMRTHLVRSLNLAQAVAIVAYEALRQNEFGPCRR